MGWLEDVYQSALGRYGRLVPPEQAQAFNQSRMSTTHEQLNALGEQPPVDIPAAGAMVPAAANLQKFMEIYKKNLFGSSPVNRALAYFYTRYPRISETRGIAPWKMPSNLQGLTPAAGPIKINKAIPNVEDAVNALGHEFTHALIQERNPALTAQYRAAPPLEELSLGELLSPSTVLDYLRYFLQKEERLARRGGKTAQRGYKKFLKLLGE